MTDTALKSAAAELHADIRDAGEATLGASITVLTNRAPAASRTSRMSTECPDGAPRSFGSVENEYWVFATQTG